MSIQKYRLASGGLIDRKKALKFTFDGREYTGHPGDTLASALLANGQRLMARSFKYHRPRGVYSAGPEEPNALVSLRHGSRAEPNTRATMAELFDGLVAESQNRWPSLKYDIQSLNGLIGPFIPAGFYYKTFMGPVGFWEKYEYFIRRAAGMGTASLKPDPDRYDKRHAHCDLLVVGGGPSGLAAALAAAETGARVILIEEHADFGGRLRRERMEIDGADANGWAEQAIAELGAQDNVTLLNRTTAFGYYDHNLIGAVERVADHLPVPEPFQVRQRLWSIRAKQVIMATGAIEQPLVFPGNDRPGVMLAGAARAYANEYGVKAGEHAVVFTNNDDAYRTALDLKAAGVDVDAIIDCRKEAGGDLANRAAAQNIRIYNGYGIAKTHGGSGGVKAVDIMSIGGGKRERIACDLVAASSGWAPVLHLHSQSGGKAVWDEERLCFVPGPSKQAECSIGAAKGDFQLADCLEQGFATGAAAAKAAGYGKGKTRRSASADREGTGPIEALWDVGEALEAKGKRFVDIQDDVTPEDVALAHREGYVSVEHLKRYTTLGMGTDQGKISNINGLAIMAGLRGQAIPDVGTTTFRPPYTPVAIGVLGGQDRGSHYMPLRRTPMYDLHAELGCQWIDAGLWKRPRYYPVGGESMNDACDRETIATRSKVGLCDVTTLGKIDVQGPDAAEFLNRLYVNGFAKLPVGKARYGLMLREDGIVDDDGTTSRLGEHHYLLTTTTAKAGPVMAKMEFYLQAIWPDLKVQISSVTDQWAGIAIAGPNARKLLERLVDLDVSNGALPFMGVAECRMCGVAARIFRISFSGELAYEVNVPADYGEAVWKALLAQGRDLGVVNYGMEALGTMRIEKGHVAGPELDGRTTAADLGLGRMQSTKKDYIGKHLKEREALSDAKRLAVVGFVPADGKTRLKQGAQIVELKGQKPPVPMIGHITSTAFSPEMGTPIALGLIEGGLAREGETVVMAYPLKNIEVEVKVTSPHFIDPKGERLHG